MAVLFFGSGLRPPIVILLGILSILPFNGLRTRQLLARSWPLLVAAILVGTFNVLLAPASSAGPDVTGGVALGLRLMGIALSGVLAVATSDPTELADSLQQQARLSPRLAVGAMAATRMLPILAVEWQLLGMARRARGVSAGWSPILAARLAFGRLLALLVGSIRRATRLALAMDARGFGSEPCRTIARPQRMGLADWGLIVAAGILGAAALGIGSAM
jgi:energy-coupling factor transport system permease protein